MKKGTKVGTKPRTVTCSKCKSSFPAGSTQAHNKRSCGTPNTQPNRVSQVPHVERKRQDFQTKTPQPTISALAQKVAQEKREENEPQRTVDQDGTIRWTLNGELHNLNRFVVEYVNGGKVWWVNGVKTLNRNNLDLKNVKKEDIF